MREKAEGVLKKWDRYKYVAAVVLLGVVLMLWPEGDQKRLPEQVLPEDHLQQELEEILHSISGVGQVQVLLTPDNDGERQLAQNTDLEYRGDPLSPETYQRSSEIILRNGVSSGEPMITQSRYPTYRGALIVCQGGDRPEVKLAVTAAVTALTGLTADRVSVAKWQSSYGGGSKR